MNLARAATAIMAGAVLFTPVAASASQPVNGDHKVTICHRTNSANNPYTNPTVDYAAVDGEGHDDHSHHTGPVYEPGLKLQHIKWGDIIPPVEGVTEGLNWTEAGQAIYNNGCQPQLVDNIVECGAEISIDFDGGLREEGVFLTTQVDPDLVGETVEVSAVGTNNDSVHVGNDLIVSSGTDTVTLSGVEDSAGKVTEADAPLTLGADLTVELELGDDKVFSGGLTLTFTCPTPEPEPTPTPTEPTPPVVTEPPVAPDEPSVGEVAPPATNVNNVCADFPTQEEAQAAMTAGQAQLDADHDGFACEALPLGALPFTGSKAQNAAIAMSLMLLSGLAFLVAGKRLKA